MHIIDFSELLMIIQNIKQKKKKILVFF